MFKRIRQAPLLALRTLLGLDVRGVELAAAPHVPEHIGTIELRGLVHGTRTDIGRAGAG